MAKQDEPADQTTSVEERRHAAGSLVEELDVPEREALYRSMFERNQAVKLLIDPASGAIVDANAAAVEFYGYSKQLLLRMKIFEINALSPEAVREEMERARAEKRTTFRFSHRLASGELREVEVFSGPIDFRGRTLLHSIVQDVTERNRAARALEESEARYRQIVDTAQEGIWTIDSAANTTFVNRRMAEMLGYAPEEMLGRPLLAFMTEEARTDATRKLERRRQGVSEVHEFRFLRKDGAEIWARIATNPLPSAGGAYAGALAMVADITESRRIAEALRRHEETLELAQRSAGAGVWAWDVGTGRLEWTPEMYRLLGLDPESDEATFDAWMKVLHPEDWEGAGTRVLKAVDTRTFLESDYRIIHPGGQVRWIRALGNTTYDAAGRPLRMAGLCLDITDRKEAETSLRVKAAVIASAINGIAISGLDGRLTYVNDAFVRMWGYGGEGEILSTDRFDYWLDPEAVRPVTEAVAAEGRWVGELVARRKDGSAFPCLVVTNRVDDAAGRPLCFMASFLDISEQKASEAALRASEHRLRSVLENLQDAYLRSDLDGRYVLVSPSAPRLFGYDSIEEMLAAPARDLYFRPEERLEVLRRIQTEGHVDDWIGQARRKDGSPLWVSMAAYAVRNEEGRVVGSQSVVRDITERVRAGERLKESERTFRIVADNTYDWEFWEEPSGRFLYCSPSCERVTGRRAEEFLADDGLLARIVHPDDRLSFLEHKKKRLEAGGGGHLHDREEVTFRIVRPDGAIRWIGHVCSTLVDEEGRFLGLRGSNRDITDRKEAEDALRRERDHLLQAEAQIRSLNADLEARVAARTADLEAAVREMEAFSYSVAHDLRAPVRAIDGFAAKLDRGYALALDDEGRRLLGTVRGSTHRMGRLIDDLLAFSRAARTELKKGPVAMDALVREVVAEVRATSGGRPADFRIVPLPEAWGDAALLREVWHNLVSNALKFSSLRPDPAVEIGARPGRDGSEYFVRDNGIGFDPAFASKLFGVFERLHPTGQFEGTGIGLALVKRIVEKHGGRVWAEGAPDHGATFWFALPRMS